MTHEFKKLVDTALLWQKSGTKSVLATVVALDGSSYRRPGVRMLVNEYGTTEGAVSGGCVEKEVVREAMKVFKTGKAAMMTYDGRYRLGCEGILYILLEPVYLSEAFSTAFHSVLNDRKVFECVSYFSQDADTGMAMGSILRIEDQSFPVHQSFQPEAAEDQESFSQQFDPLLRLYIFGAEHDAVQLCLMARQLGWEVHIIASPDEGKSLQFFPGATSLLTPTFEALDPSLFDENTAVILMTHSFSKDAQYLMALRGISPAYFGLLGPVHRRERLFSELLERFPETSPQFIEQIHGPAGINIGAESAAEIALSILSEILSLIRAKTPIALRDKKGGIHD